MEDLEFDATTGWIEGITHKRSPNYNQRPNNTEINLLVIHCMSLPKGNYQHDYVIDLFQNKLDISKDASFEALKDLKVSAHFLIRRNGEIIQFVSIYDRAWHAGVSAFQQRENCNNFSIGIELEGTDDSEYERRQYKKLIKLTKILIKYTKITKDRIIGHSHISPNRKTDPGVLFDWGMYLKSL
ncbi:1,6-anhydro-N-acetylmuramyl-L-alanine amidase AmpD [Thiotrichales bacterium 19S11-10]|nr:1,6-anhydro-N-acetylmuramyl-L-alanine amidase AmpD [Thiotrichales bacterium 19S11-10]